MPSIEEQELTVVLSLSLPESFLGPVPSESRGAVVLVFEKGVSSEAELEGVVSSD